MVNNVDIGNNSSVIVLYRTKILIMMKSIKLQKKGTWDYHKCITCEYETETDIIRMLIAQVIRFYEKYDYRSDTDDGVILVVA